MEKNWTIIALQHIVNGVVKRDAFKIVYVAPMKALAAEMTANFGRRLAPLGITVRELTGDMQLTKAEIAQTQMLVTTPEKWDVVTRKPGDVSLAQLVRLVGGIFGSSRGCVFMILQSPWWQVTISLFRARDCIK